MIAIDLYFPEYRLAIECDEFDHKERVIDYGILRHLFAIILMRMTSKYVMY